jgi:hypothetical protein
VTKQCTEWSHQIKFRDPEVSAKTAGYTYQLVKEASGIQLHPNNINRDEKFKCSQAANPAIKILQIGDVGNINITRLGKFYDGCEKPQQANIEDYTPG